MTKTVRAVAIDPPGDSGPQSLMWKVSTEMDTPPHSPSKGNVRAFCVVPPSISKFGALLSALLNQKSRGVGITPSDFAFEIELKCFWDTLTHKIVYLILKVSNFRGDLTDISLAETAVLKVPRPIVIPTLWCGCNPMFCPWCLHQRCSCCTYDKMKRAFCLTHFVCCTVGPFNSEKEQKQCCLNWPSTQTFGEK